MLSKKQLDNIEWHFNHNAGRIIAPAYREMWIDVFRDLVEMARLAIEKAGEHDGG